MPSIVRTRLRILALTVLLAILWVAAVTTVALMKDSRIAVSGPGTVPLMAAARQAAAAHRGNLALVVIDDGRVADSLTMSIGRPVNGDSLFQMASVSKWVTAWGVMRLVEAGKLDLDAPVSRYLRRWQLPPTDFDNDQVTVRRLLSHTAGLTDGLGYCGFAPGQPVQTLEASLVATADACPLTNGRVAVGKAPGEWQYSGGGFSVLQLLVEEVSGQPFAAYMDTAVFEPLGMTRSTFRTGARGSPGIVQFFDSDGSPAPHRHYTAAAAASLYATTSDLSRFVIAHTMGPNGEPAGRGVVSPATLAAMATPQARLDDRPHWGLGMRLYARNTAGGLIIGHDGGNVPAVNTTVRLDPATGDGIVALSTGGSGIASRLGTAWLEQRADPATLTRELFNALTLRAAANHMLGWVVGGLLVILTGGAILWGRARQPRVDTA